MRVAGIDPGIGRLGWAVVDKCGSRLTAVAYGLIETPPGPVPARLQVIHQSVLDVFRLHGPDALATERLLFTKNQTTAMDVAKALGCVLLAGAESELPHTEYSPPEIKLAVTGTGSAEKRQVQFMVAKLLGLAETPKPDDVADALAIAVTHALRHPAGQAVR